MRKEELAHSHMRMMQQKQERAESDFKKELEYATQAQALLDQNEKQFYSYAEQCIK